MKVLFLLFLLIPVFCIGQAPDTITYSIVSAGAIKGFSKTWKTPDGMFENWFQYNDRGRGDSLRVQYRETEDGFPIFMKAAGVDYMKNPVFEEFSLENDVAIWKNPVEEGEESISDKAFYIGLKADAGHLVKAMHANKSKIKLIPYGEMQMLVLGPHQLQKDGEKVKVILVEIKGNGYAPSYQWVDEKYIEFGSVNDWMSIIRQGYEYAIPELLQIQKRYEQNYFAQIAATTPNALGDVLLIKNVNVFNAKEAKMIYGQDVLIKQGLVSNISPSKRLDFISSSGLPVIDGSGQTLLPGLWDMHTHTSDIMEGILFMACGITHLRDMGNDESILTKQKQFSDGMLIGPRIEVTSGLIDFNGPMAAPTGALINTLEEGLQAVRDFAGKGYQQIKIYSSIPPEWVKPLADEAHKLKMRACGHIPAFMTASEAIRDGYDEITHMNMLALNFFGDTIDTRIPLRFSIPAERTASLDLESKTVQDFIQYLKTEDIAVDPTLNIFEKLFTAQDKVVSPVYAWAVDHFPLQAQRQMKAGGGGLPVPPGMDSTYQKSFSAFKHLLKELYDHGIRILPGTDAYPGFSLFRELELYVQAGIPPEKVLQFATWNNAVYTGTDATFGSIEVGKVADFIMVHGDPVKDITNIRNTKLVVTNDRVYYPNKLFGAISISPF